MTKESWEKFKYFEVNENEFKAYGIFMMHQICGKHEKQNLEGNIIYNIKDLYVFRKDLKSIAWASALTNWRKKSNLSLNIKTLELHAFEAVVYLFIQTDSNQDVPQQVTV